MRALPLAVLLGAALALTLGGERDARANGRFPASNAMVFSPSDPRTVYARVTFGLLASRDGGGSWRWVCERAIGYASQEDPTYVVTPKGTLVAGLFEGLRVSRDGGCSWQSVDTGGTKSFVDVTMRADGTVYALSSAYDGSGDGGGMRFRTQVWVSTDDARTFTKLGPPIDPGLLAESMEIAEGDPSRIYVSAVRGSEPPRRGVLLASTDRGATFVERAVPTEAHEIAPFIAAVDPARPGRVYLRTAGPPDKDTHLLVTDDGGRAFRTLITARGPLHGFALAKGGDLVFAGGPDAGFFAGAPSGPIAKTSDQWIQCLGVAGETLWACSREASGFFLGRSTDRGARFEAALHLGDLEGPLACPADSSVARDCGAEWAELSRTLGKDSPPADAGPPDAGRPDAAAPKAAPPPPAPSGARWIVIAVVIAAGLGAGIFVSRRRR